MCVYVCAWFVCVYMVYMCLCICVCVHVYLHMHVCLCTRLCAFLCLCVCMTCVCVHMSVYLCPPTCTCLALRPQGQAASLALLILSNPLPQALGSEMKPHIFFLFMLLAKSPSNLCSLPLKSVSGVAINKSICECVSPSSHSPQCMCHRRHMERETKILMVRERGKASRGWGERASDICA